MAKTTGRLFLWIGFRTMMKLPTRTLRAKNSAVALAGSQAKRGSFL